MGIFGKAMQHIVVAHDDQPVLETLAAELRARKLQDVKVSSVHYSDGRWQCAIACKSAEVLYNQELVHLLYDSPETQSCQVLLMFDDKSALVGSCPQELLVSFGFDSRYAFGNEAENSFLHELQHDIVQDFADMPAAVTYCIIGGVAATLCVPCADPKTVEGAVRKKLTKFKAKQFVIHIVDRGPA